MSCTCLVIKCMCRNGLWGVCSRAGARAAGVGVGRVEGFCPEPAWKRAYSEINQFERQLTDFGTILFKFWVHIGQDEQLKRFKEWEKTNYKSWKLTDED